MIILEKKFLKPSKTNRVLALLENLSVNPTLSQAELAQKCALSGAMVNAYLKTLRKDDLIQIEPINGKSYAYRLTANGEHLRQQYLVEYSTELVQLYTSLKSVIRNKINFLQQQGQRRVALFGASETCEIVLTAMRETQVRIIAVVDNDPGKHGQLFHGHVIASPAILDQLAFDTVLITTFARQAEIQTQLEPLAHQHNFIIARL